MLVSMHSITPTREAEERGAVSANGLGSARSDLSAPSRADVRRTATMKLALQRSWTFHKYRNTTKSSRAVRIMQSCQPNSHQGGLPRDRFNRFNVSATAAVELLDDGVERFRGARHAQADEAVANTLDRDLRHRPGPHAAVPSVASRWPRRRRTPTAAVRRCRRIGRAAGHGGVSGCWAERVLCGARR